MAGCRDDKERRGLHLGCKAAELLPGLPLFLQFIPDRHPVRAVLSVEGVLALHDTGVIGNFHVFCAPYQGIDDVKVCDRRVLDRSVLPARSLHADSTRRNDGVPGEDIGLHAPAGADADKRVDAAVYQFLHRDRRRGAADAGGRDGDLFPVQCSRIGDKLPGVRDADRAFEVLCDLLAPLRVPWKDAVASHLARFYLDMILPFRIF